MLQPHLLSADTTSELRVCVVPPFVCNTSRGLSATWIQVIGELDLAAAPLLTAALRDAMREPHLTVLDLRELTFFDSAGVHAIVEASAIARRVSRHLLVVPARDHVQRIFALSGTSEGIDVLKLDPGEQPVQTSRLRSRRTLSVLAL